MSSCETCPAASRECCDVEDVDLPTIPAGSEFRYAPMFQHVTAEEQRSSTAAGSADIPRHEAKGWTKVEGDWVDVMEAFGRKIVRVKPGALEHLAHLSMVEIQHFFRADQLAGWRRILDDPESSDNDRFVAHQLLKNACIASGKVLPSCQDTGTAIIMGKKGESVWTDAESCDEEQLSKGIWNAYVSHNLRYSQVAPVDMFEEVNTKTNLPVQCDLLAMKGSEYQFLTIAKGGGSANKSMLFQQTKSLLNPKSLRAFVREKLKTLGTSACPPYHVALVIGGTSAELTMKTVKLASCRYYDALPTTGDASTARAFRDIEWERIVMEECQALGIGAQFGGKYFAHQVRVIRLPRHGASCPVGLGVSCSADRQILAKITADGMFLEELEHDPARYLPEVLPESLRGGGDSAAVVHVDLNQPMDAVRKELSKHAIKTRLSLTGTIVVARDIAHAKIQELLDRGEPMPQYLKDYCVYYAGPAKTPKGYASGSFGPTTAGRMDSFVDPFQKEGGSMVMLAKGNRSKQVTDACKANGGFYLGSIGGPAAVLATEAIKKVEVLDMEELGMEAVWKIDVENFPAFVVVDNKGNDFFKQLK